jgi:hypothetical protein
MSKILFQICIARDFEPPPFRKNLARLRAKIPEFPCNPARKSLARPSGVPIAFGFKTIQFFCGAFILPNPNLFPKSE